MEPFLNNFFGCMTLETGGIIIAWCTIIGGVLGAFVCVIGLIFAILEIKKLKKPDENNTCDIYRQNNAYACYLKSKTSLIVGTSFLLLGKILLVITFVAGLLLLYGIDNQVPGKMILSLVILALGVFGNFLRLIASVDCKSRIQNFIITLLVIYLFLTVISLYHKVEMENKPGNVTTTISSNWTTII